MAMRWIGKACSAIGTALLALLAIGLFWLFQAAVYVGLLLGWMVAVKAVAIAFGAGGAMATGIGVAGALVLTIASVVWLERIATRLGYKGLFEPLPF